MNFYIRIDPLSNTRCHLIEYKKYKNSKNQIRVDSPGERS